MFYVGQKVEVCSKQKEFIGSYYEATVIKCEFSPSSSIISYHVQYRNLIEEDSDNPLVEKVSADEMRPIPPPKPPCPSPSKYPDFKMFEVVDVFENSGWWSGQITGRHGRDRFFVCFPPTGEKLDYHHSQLRHHLDWTNRNWISRKIR
ncbi:hypothetical protein K2173_026091 [Erythroxylum novogranatense]|uniref:Agenet domain-containing protein n=1 Tax=Erythroxylum novogranatense TaxID=1862640 RepID=A0AAV8TZA8_9ROSI|nr:hypothetical protein K2173_026091 [Erythroxylum novogranatense]